MIDIFNNKIDLTNITCHSGGAKGADFFFSRQLVLNSVLRPGHIPIGQNIMILQTK